MWGVPWLLTRKRETGRVRLDEKEKRTQAQQVDGEETKGAWRSL